MFIRNIQNIKESYQIVKSCFWHSKCFRSRSLNITKTQVNEYHEITGNILVPGKVPGIDYLRDPRVNKGLAFSIEERQILGIHGLQPAHFRTQEEQLMLCRISINRYKMDINKYIYLTDLQDTNERLFFRFLSENIEELLPIVYTPTVGIACQTFGLIYRRPRGLFISILDKGHIFNVLKNWPEPDVRAICVTDGERILGLGDLGAYGMGIPIGKLSLYTALASVKPHQCLPILLDVGTNNNDLLNDPLYIGLREQRLSGSQYDEFLDEFMQAVGKRYNQNTLIQFEDFGCDTAFKCLDKYKNSYCTFNDDIQGTGAVVLAGLIASQRLTKKKVSDHTIVIAGSGEAGIGIADMCVSQMLSEGLTKKEAKDRIWMVDLCGLLTTTRKVGDLKGHKKIYARNSRHLRTLEEIVLEAKPSVLLGATACTGLFTSNILKAMAIFNARPIIFALSNPTSKAECTAEEAFNHTDGKAIFSSGSPFKPVVYKGKIYKSGQGNNAYIFPGLALGIIATGAHHVADEMFLIAARTLADFVTEKELEDGLIFPSLKNVREVSLRIALEITKYSYSKGLAGEYPEPKDKLKWLKAKLYNYHYTSVLPTTWKWKQTPRIDLKQLKENKLLKSHTG